MSGGGWSDKTKVRLNSTQVEVEVWVVLSWAWQKKFKLICPEIFGSKEILGKKYVFENKIVGKKKFQVKFFGPKS